MKKKRMTKDEIKKRIHQYEWEHNGKYLGRINGGDIKVGKVDIDKEQGVVWATITMYADGEKTVYDECQYPFKIFGMEVK